MEALPEACGVEGYDNFPLNRLSFVGTEGVARLVLFPREPEQLVKLLRQFESHGVPFVVCGLCSNTLWGDGYFNGAVVCTRDMGEIEVDGDRVLCHAGVRNSKFLKVCRDAGLTGWEPLWGIPGTVGASVAVNSGAFGRSYGELVEWVECYRDGEVLRLKKDEIAFYYRGSSLRGTVVLRVCFRLTVGTFDAETLENVAISRRERFPSGRTLGSVFKNPSPFYAGKLIEEAGLKGYSMGRVKVSDKHGNFIISFKGATAKDYVGLVNLVKERVFSLFGVVLREEIVYAGAFS